MIEHRTCKVEERKGDFSLKLEELEKRVEKKKSNVPQLLHEPSCISLPQTIVYKRKKSFVMLCHKRVKDFVANDNNEDFVTKIVQKRIKILSWKNNKQGGFCYKRVKTLSQNDKTRTLSQTKVHKKKTFHKMTTRACHERYSTQNDKKNALTY